MLLVLDFYSMILSTSSEKQQRTFSAFIRHCLAQLRETVIRIGLWVKQTYLTNLVYLYSISSFQGYCGLSQPAANLLGIITGDGEAESSHTLCNDFYINAFEHNFFANNAEKCPGVTRNLPPNFRMGYMETRKRLIAAFSFKSSILIMKVFLPVRQFKELLRHQLPEILHTTK